MAFVIGKLVKGAASGIGMASEGVHAYKHRHDSDPSITNSPARRTSPSPSRHGDAPGSRDDVPDEQAWELDDAQEELVTDGGQASAPVYAHLSKEARDDIAKNPRLQAEFFLDRYPPPEQPLEPCLPCPVILPQRRPKDKSRGFVRAYAPVLDDCGMDQLMFLDFLETFDRAKQASPWINCINLACITAGFIPDGVSILVSGAIRQCTNVAIELQSRQR